MSGEITALKEWITNRLYWIDHNIPNAGACEDWQDIANENLEVSIYPNPNQWDGCHYQSKNKRPSKQFI